ncbi:lysophospholipid acyltransferase family protein [bacterium]|nr:lysophospholipid acyltransferase family protein [bacterium]
MRKVRWLIEWMFAWPFLRLVQLLPQPIALGLGRSFGWIAYFLLRNDRKWCLRNLELVFGDQLTPRERKRLARGVFANIGLTICEILRMTEEWVRENVDFRGADLVREMIARGERIVVVGGHLGNWEIFGACWKYLQHPSVMIARPLDNPYLERELERCRNNYCLSTVKRNNVSIRQGVQMLREGYALGIAIDLNVCANQSFINFLGIPASTATGAAKIALRENASVISIAPVRDPDGKFRLIIDRIEITRTGDFQHDVQENMQRITNVWSKWVANYPEQWHWQHPRWRTRPDGSDWTLEQNIQSMIAERSIPFLTPPRRCKEQPQGVRQPQTST